MSNKIDETKLINEKWNRLKIVKAYREGKHIMCDCDCDCGGYKKHIRYSSLKNGSTQSCGCLQRENASKANMKYSDLSELIGMKFGKLKIINATRKGKKSLIYCDCECECKNISNNIQLGSLQNGSVVSCGCYAKEQSSIRLAEQQKKYNEYRNEDNYMVGICSNGEEFIFDKEDYNKIKEYCWYVKYPEEFILAYNPNTKKHMALHRFVMNCPDDMEVDHIFHNRHDNRKSQLRICTSQQNKWNTRTGSKNTSGHKNVQWSKAFSKWEVVISGKYIGRYDSYEEACKVEEEKEIEMYGEYSIFYNHDIKQIV